MLYIGMTVLVATPISAGDRMATFATLIGFFCYLRPGELCGLTLALFLAPVYSAPQKARYWGLFLGPTELLRPTNAQGYEESVLLDGPETAWAHKLSPELANV